MLTSGRSSLWAKVVNFSIVVAVLVALLSGLVALTDPAGTMHNLDVSTFFPKTQEHILEHHQEIDGVQGGEE